ncbi:SLC29A4 [Lepeophtheirus salmonis]|uniref:SLC29A4 n=2 Tax=Lepeophtheirus salmonis TaxID=72036 RepID=A0A7R8H065_LEPSM|nr:SLC29A4 [Lepeophtheirus salmonis]CAF2763900.1 SLC29A4 [Lepeophtheirus salmonis]
MIMSTPKETKDSIMTSQHHSIPFIGDYSSLSSSNSEEEEEKEEEDELNDGRKGKGGIIILKPRPLPESEPPIDHNQLVYVSMILAGVGFLLPYNSFIVAVDYYQDKFGGTIIFDLSVTYILTSFIAVILNNMLVESVSVHFRITSGYTISFITLCFVAFFEIGLNIFPQEESYTITLVAVAFVAFGCTIQQSSFYGYSSMLPSRYTQAIMIGESTAGFLLSVNRILTKDLIQDVKMNTLLFFCISIGIVGLCWLLFIRVRKSTFVKHYINYRERSSPNPVTNTSTIILEPKEERGLNESRTCCPAVVRPEDGFEESGLLLPPEFGESCRFHRRYRVEDVVVTVKGSSMSFGRSASKSWKSIKAGLRSRWEISKNIWTYMCAISLTYFVTLLLFPGIESEIISCNLGSWMPVLLMAVFNFTDLVGKVMASLPYSWSGSELFLMSMARLILVPLMVMCAAPRHAPLLKGEGWAILVSAALGLSNGIFGSIPMILAPGKVQENQRELVGNLMTFSYSLGLTGGSCIAYFLEDLLGPPLLRPYLSPSLNSTSWMSSTRTTSSPPSSSNLQSATLNLTQSILGTAIGISSLMSTSTPEYFSSSVSPDNGFISPALHNLTIPML